MMLLSSIVLTISALLIFHSSSSFSQGVFDPKTFTEASCSGSNRWTNWLDTNNPTMEIGDFEVTSHIQQLYQALMCPRPVAIEARTIFEASPAATGDVYQVSISEGLKCLNPHVDGFKTKLCNDYKVRYCCAISEMGQVLPASRCGKQAIQPFRQRIVGGFDANPNSWPWLVSLQMDGSHICGGSLVTENHVVTAAHCLDRNVNPSRYSIVTGLHARTSLIAGRSQRIPVRQIFIHEQYDTPHNSENNDIAVLRLSQPAQLNNYVSLICLPGPDPPSNAPVTIAGWGLLNENGILATNLKQATVQIMATQCQYVYGSFNNQKQICAGNPQFTKDTCQGDSGGPLMYESNGVFYLNGVVSYGNGCARPNYPGVYTRVSYYVPWINSKLAQ